MLVARNKHSTLGWSFQCSLFKGIRHDLGRLNREQACRQAAGIAADTLKRLTKSIEDMRHA